ncbi:hypothetical protein PYCC9005_001750 [Savitreella phatthalungensis]
MSTLSDEQLEKFEADGCLVIPDFLSAEQVAGLRTRIDELLAAFDPAAHPLSLFKTGNADQDDYFLTSGDKVRFFLEAAAVDADGSLLVPKDRAVNKIGHALHELEPVFATISVTDRVRTMVRQLNMTDPVVLQSMAILKQPRVGGAVPPHQDSTFLYTHTPSAIGFWFALEDCTLTNGCLSFAKGSHKTCPVTHRFVRQHSADGKKITTAMERLCDGDNDTTVSDAAYEPATSQHVR